MPLLPRPAGGVGGYSGEGGGVTDRYVRCPACNRVVAERIGSTYVLRHGGKVYILPESEVDCACGHTFQLPRLQKETA